MLTNRDKLILLGCSCGFISGFFGISGGIFLVPLLLLHFHYSNKEAVKTSLLTIIPIALFSIALQFLTGKMTVQFLTIFYLFIGILLGTKIGVYILPNIKKSTLLFGFSGTLFLLALSLLNILSLPLLSLPMYTKILLGILVGMSSALLGIGGGILIIPILSSFYNVPLFVAIHTSLLIIPISAFIAYLTLDKTIITSKIKKFNYYNNLAIIVSSALLGAILGVSFNIFISTTELLELLFGIFLILYSIYLMYKTYLKYFLDTGKHKKMIKYVKHRFKYGKSKEIYHKKIKIKFR